MTTIDAQALIRKADNGEQMLAFLEIIAQAAASGNLSQPEEAAEEAAEEAEEAAEEAEDEPLYDEDAEAYWDAAEDAAYAEDEDAEA
jgi:hypothetical protein